MGRGERGKEGGEEQGREEARRKKGVIEEDTSERDRGGVGPEVVV